MIWLKDTVEAFLNEQGFKESTRVVYLRGLLLLSRAEESNEKPIYRFSESEMHHTFRSITTGLRTRQKLRSLVDRYMDWVARKGIDVSKGKESLGTLDMAILERESTKLYFYGIHQLLTKLKYDVEYIAAQAGRQQSDYRMIKSALILLWSGIRLPEVVEITKVGVLSERNAVIHAGKRYAIDSDAYRILEECARATFYTKVAYTGVSEIEYAPGKYLLRTADSESMSTDTIKQYISIFNANLYEKSPPYKPEKVYWSGVFFRTYEFETRGGGLDAEQTMREKIPYYEMLFREKYDNPRQLADRLKEYSLYTSVFRNKK